MQTSLSMRLQNRSNVKAPKLATKLPVPVQMAAKTVTTSQKMIVPLNGHLVKITFQKMATAKKGRLSKRQELKMVINAQPSQSVS